MAWMNPLLYVSTSVPPLKGDTVDVKKQLVVDRCSGADLAEKALCVATDGGDGMVLFQLPQCQHTLNNVIAALSVTTSGQLATNSMGPE